MPSYTGCLAGSKPQAHPKPESELSYQHAYLIANNCHAHSAYAFCLSNYSVLKIKEYLKNTYLTDFFFLILIPSIEEPLEDLQMGILAFRDS